jgi:hypothetical protein
MNLYSGSKIRSWMVLVSRFLPTTVYRMAARYRTVGLLAAALLNFWIASNSQTTG